MVNPCTIHSTVPRWWNINQGLDTKSRVQQPEVGPEKGPALDILWRSNVAVELFGAMVVREDQSPPEKITTSIFVSLATEISIGWFQLTGCWRLPSKQTWQNLFRRFCLRKIMENNRSKWVTFHCHVWLPEGSDYTWRATDTWRTWSWMFMLLGDTWCRRLVAWNGSYMVHIFKNMFSSEIMWIETKTNTQVLLGLDSLLIYLLCTFS